MEMIQLQAAPSHGKHTDGSFTQGHPCLIAKGSEGVMRSILDFFRILFKTELWKYKALTRLR